MQQEWPEITQNAVQGQLLQADASAQHFVRYRIKPLGDFVNVKGNVKQIYGCSCAESDEFLERVEYLRKAVQSAAPEQSFEQLMADPLFNYSVQRCLEMHGLGMHDVSVRHVQDLLLYEVVDSELKPGMLVRLNMPRDFDEAEAETMNQLGQDASKATYERALAIMSTHTESVEEAVRLTHAMTMQQISTLLSEKAALAKTVDKQADTRDLLKYLDSSELIPVNESML